MASLLELPHTSGCLVCGRDNPHGLKLASMVEPTSGTVHVEFSPHEEHIGFAGIVHGGLLATVIDEAMVWAATWKAKRFCVCGEMSVRFRQIAKVGEKLKLDARVTKARSRLIETTAEIRNAAGDIVAEASGKYVPMSEERSREFMGTLVIEPATDAARELLTGS